MARLYLSLLCMVMLVGGIVSLKIFLSLRVAKARSISFLEAASGTQWLRDDSGRIRWFVPAWVTFWFLANVAVGLFIR